MKVGDIYEIRNRRRNCNGIPFIRIERIDATGEVWVSDWDTPQKRAYRPPLACGYTFPDVRRFAGADDFAKRIRYWKRLPPNKYITQARYEKFSPAVRRWYKPYRCSGCAERGAGFDACDMATAAAQGFRRGQAAAKQEG